MEAVHEARKDLKKLRALVRMARGELGDDTYRRENACFRDAARELAGVRDTDVMLETLDGARAPRRAGVGAPQDDPGHRCGTAAAAAARPRGRRCDAEEARARVDGWSLERDSFELCATASSAPTGAAGATSRRGAEPTVEALHEWRKRVKDLWYQHTLLRALWPPVMEAAGDEAHELSDRLGDDHDLAVLAAWVSEHTEAGPEFFEAVDARRCELQDAAFALGARVYAEKPSAYVAAAEEAVGRQRARS